MADVALLPTMKLHHDDWTHAGVTYLFREAGYTNSAALHAANEYVSLVEQLVKCESLLVGWSFNGDEGEFTGPARPDCLAKVMEVITSAMDKVLEDV